MEIAQFSKIFLIFDKGGTPEHTEVYDMLAKSKVLGQMAKRNRKGPYSSRFGLQLPSKEISDKMVEAYLRTFERVYRVVHIPSFLDEYDRCWHSAERTDEAFIIKLQLCLAIGACFYDEPFSFRPSAIQWVHEAQQWLTGSIAEKSRMTIVGLQIMCLLHLARQTAGVGADLGWISIGTLFRTAMYMGLHRDPIHLPKVPLFQAEQRRRLWGTIIELTLQSSVESGGPPLFSTDDFDTEPPSNLDDNELEGPDTATPVPKAPEVYTDSSLLIVIRKSLALRLEIAKFVNNFRSPPTFEETLRLNAELTAACRTLTQEVNSFQKSDSRPSPFHSQLLEHIIRPFFIVLHMPFMKRAFESPAYCFSRKMMVNSALKLYTTSCPDSTLVSGTHVSAPDRAQHDYARLTICGSGPFRNIVLRAHMIIAAEVIAQLEEDEGLAPRVDLLHALRGMSTWTRWRQQAGETNIKCHLFATVILTYVDCLMQGLEVQQTEKVVLARGLVSLKEAIDMLQLSAGGSPLNGSSPQGGTVLTDNTAVLDGDWSWADLVSWLFFCGRQLGLI